VFEGLCAYVTGKNLAGAQMLDVALVNTQKVNLAGVTNHEHIPTLSIHREAVKDLGGVAPVAADVEHVFFNIKGKRLRFTPRTANATALTINETPISTNADGCPFPSKSWTSFHWLMDFSTELDKTGSAKLRKGWRQDGGVVDALIELRHGLVEDASLFTPDVPGNETARVYSLPASGKKRALKDAVRTLIDVPLVDLEIANLDGTRPRTIQLDCGSLRRHVRITQVPAHYATQANSMHDLAAFWLLTDKAGDVTGGGSIDLPKPQAKTCIISATGGCGCCPGPRMVEVDWGVQ
jgi:hypothetical protein